MKKKYKVYRQFDIKTDVQQVLRFMECTPHNPMYHQMKNLCIKMEEMFYQKIEPFLAVDFRQREDCPPELEEADDFAFVLMTLGSEISAYIEAAFGRGSYMEGMMLDAMADDYLFQLGEKADVMLQEECEKRGFGVQAKLEAPTDIRGEIQSVLLEKMQQRVKVPVKMTKGFMFEPVKTMGYVLVLTEDKSVCLRPHDCQSCEKKDCMMRKPELIVEVLYQNKSYDIPYEKGKSIYQLLVEQEFPVPGICAGRGTCGKCKIKLDWGELPVTEEDRLYFSDEQIASGWRLSCLAYPEKSCTIMLEEEEQSIKGISQFYKGEAGQKKEKSQKYYIAVDIGTTTLAFLLTDENEEQISSYTAMNSQRTYGADVISRQMAWNNGKQEALQISIWQDLEQGISALLTDSGIREEQIELVTVACNTTMGHILLGYDLGGLGKYPYNVVNLNEVTRPYHSIIKNSKRNMPLTVMAGISAYVGGDIAAGLYMCEFEKLEKPCLFLDLGTNGEMALGTAETIYVTATAAGPAFEGGNIKWGTGSVPGAICRVNIEGGRAQVETIDGRPAVGICGTGVLEGIAELVKNGIADNTGLLTEPYFEHGYELARTAAENSIVLTQKDIRQFQMAKGAVRAGIEVLLEKSGLTYDEIDTVYLAGGFGFYLDKRKAIVTGIVPAAVHDKIKVIGNSSLAGACLYGSEGNPEALEQIVSRCVEIHLSKESNFQDLYMKHMYFGESI